MGEVARRGVRGWAWAMVEVWARVEEAWAVGGGVGYGEGVGKEVGRRCGPWSEAWVGGMGQERGAWTVGWRHVLWGKAWLR